MKVVIIEDETITVKDLATTLKLVDNKIKIVASLKSVKEAINYFENNSDTIDLIYSDIQLGDGLSFEIFKRVPVNAPIIFCTAYNEYSLNAFEVNSIHYMLKPFDKESVSEALRKYHEIKGYFSHDSSQYQAIIDLLNQKPQKQSILVYVKDKIVPVSISDVAVFYIDNEDTFLITLDNNKYTIKKSLDELEQIAGSGFYRANRQYLINRKAIKDTSQYFARKLAVNLNVPLDDKITISKNKVSEFLNWLTIS